MTIGEINNSHLPDLTERLIEAHRILQMSREYLMPLAIEFEGHPDAHHVRAFNHACDNILDAMGDIELAIAKLQQP